MQNTMRSMGSSSTGRNSFVSRKFWTYYRFCLSHTNDHAKPKCAIVGLRAFAVWD